MAHQPNNTGRHVALAGGGALLLWLLLRGSGSGGASSAPTSAPVPAPAPRTPCRVRIDAAGIQIDGGRADVRATIERCRAAGSAEVKTTGDAVVGVVTSVVRGLVDAGVVVSAPPDVWSGSGVPQPGAS